MQFPAFPGPELRNQSYERNYLFFVDCVHYITNWNETPVDLFIYMYFPIQAKMTRMRQRIGQRLKDSQNTYAMLTTFNEVDMR